MQSMCKKIGAAVTLFSVSFLLSLAFSSMSANAAAVSVNGSTTVLPVMQKLVESYMKVKPEAAITVSGGGSGNGIKALLDNNADIAMSSREMKPAEKKLAEERGLAPQPLAIGIDAVLPVVHPGNPVNGLTRAELRAIYTGAIKNWKEVGGEDRPIVAVSRDTSSGTYEAWGELIMQGQKVSPAALLSASSGAMMQAVAKNRYAIGYDSYGYLNSSVKALKVDGIAGTPENAANGSYPVARKLWIITAGKAEAKAKNPAEGPATDFINFIMSAEGRAIITSCGIVPVQ